MISDLLPLENEAPRCSDFAQSLALKAPGTGLFLDRVVLVSAPLPWPKPALKHELLFAAGQAVNASTAADNDMRTRLFAVEPTASHEVGAIEVFERSTMATRHLTLQTDATPEAIAGSVSTILSTPLGQLEGETSVPPTFLVCTQGSHDVCCGVTGVEFADALEHARPDFVVRRVSHTGGHRFSPTLLALPSGRMWAFADLDLVDRIANDAVTADDLRERHRGWWGAPVGYAQVAETAVQAELCGAPGAAALTVTALPVADGSEQHEFLVELGDSDGETSRKWHVAVEVGRTVPSIACESPGGLPAKPGREFRWTIAER